MSLAPAWLSMVSCRFHSALAVASRVTMPVTVESELGYSLKNMLIESIWQKRVNRTHLK